MKKNLLRLSAFLFLVVAISAGICFVTTDWFVKRGGWRHDEPHGHQWLHKTLGLSDAEARQIDVFESEYRTQRGDLLIQFRSRIEKLAELLKSSDSYSPEVQNAVHSLHEIHGQLQTLSIEHFYEMMSVLPPEKQARMRDLAIDALSTPE